MAVGHRVVHGRPRIHGAGASDRPRRSQALERPYSAGAAAPAAQPSAHRAACLKRAPDVPQVACFDTSFHRTNPEVARRFACRPSCTTPVVQRYGFHGLSYEYIAAVLPHVDRPGGRRPDDRDASGERLEHVRDGGGARRGDDDGLQRRGGAGDGHSLRRAGSGRDPVSPGRAQGMDARRHRAPALQRVRTARDLGHLQRHADVAGERRPVARELAIDVYVYRIARELGSLAAALADSTPSCSPAVSARTRPRSASECVGMRPGSEWSSPPAANAGGGPRISVPDSRVSAWVVPHERGTHDRATHAARAGPDVRRDACGSRTRSRWSAALVETGSIDTVYRDLYLETGADAVELAGVARGLPSPSSSSGKGWRSCPSRSHARCRRTNWPLVKELSLRADAAQAGGG